IVCYVESPGPGAAQAGHASLPSNARCSCSIQRNEAPRLAGRLDPEGPPVGGPMHRTQETRTMSDSMPHPAETAPQAPKPWDPFQLMDRLDEEALRRELDGVGTTDLVYVVREGGQEVVGLSKTGVDECCMALASQGQVIREEDLQYEVIG